jgi:hypothetical protein
MWLNLLVDDCQFGYITKLIKKRKKRKKSRVIYWQWSFLNEFRYIFGGVIYIFSNEPSLYEQKLSIFLSPNII